VHCDEVAVKTYFSEEDVDKKHPFCCFGCLTVHQVLHEKGLSDYYEIKKNSAIYKRRSPVEIKTAAYKFLDDEEFLKSYSYLNSHYLRVMEFYLEGIHCLACLWLIEKLPEFLLTVVSAKLDLERSVVTIVMKEEGKFSEVARELNHLGYRPHPLKKNEDVKAFKMKSEREALTRIGIAGAAAGNIMIYAVSLYGGASHEFATLFNNLTVAFAVPVLTYSAFPFYQTAWNALRNKTLSIDIPISLALIMGGVMGIYNLLHGVAENYFDSLTTLVFLLLLSRYFLQKIQDKGLSAQDLHYFYQSESVLKCTQDDFQEFSEIHPKFIKVGDVLKILKGEFIPVDGIILEGESSLNASLLTGESLPVKVRKGESVFSGTQNLTSELLIRTDKVQNETRLGGILKNVENGWIHKSSMMNLITLVSKYFTLAVFILSAVLFIFLYQKGDFHHAFEQAMTLLIVTCPCALALAIPLTFTRSLSKASEHGMIIKSDEVLEKLSRVQNIFLDKTGTLTYGKLQVEHFVLHKDPLFSIYDIIYSLEQRSGHPVARALLDYVNSFYPKDLVVEDFKEILGHGVFGRLNGVEYEINRQGLFQNNELMATFEVKDLIREDAKNVLENLKSMNKKISILSGDKASVVKKMADEVHLTTDEIYSELSPEEKLTFVKSSSHTLMVGDGANDAEALAQADVGVAVLGAMDISLRAADVYLTIPGLSMIEKLLLLSEETMKVIRRNLFLSLLYNGTSVVAVFTGVINPLIAAIIMPMSSLTVLISTLIGTKKLRNLWKS